MTKTTTAGMDTHLDQPTTSLATAWLITRTDGQKFRFTSNSVDVQIDVGDGDGVQTYSAEEGYNRSNLSADAEMNVGNMDIVGIFDNAQITEQDLRNGLFDFADVKIFFFNHQDISDGIIKILRGEFGRATVSPLGFFNIELRDLTQVYSKEIGEHYSKDCRDDLGGLRCLIPINPTILTKSTAVSVGQFFRILTTPDDCQQIIMNFEGADEATSGPGFDNIGLDGTQPTINGNSKIDTAETPAGGSSTSSLFLDGTGDYLSWTDRTAWELGTGPVTISAHFRLNATGQDHTIISQYNSVGNQRGWFIRVNASNNLNFRVYSSGGSGGIDVELTGGTTLTTGVDYHVAVVRKNDGDWVMFLDGAIEDGPDTPSLNPFNSTAPLRIGALESSGSPALFAHAWIDSVEFIPGFARWETTFTPPTGNVPAMSINSNPIAEDFSDRIYVVTVAGTTGLCVLAPDTVVGNTHTQGTATLEAEESWTRAAEVIAVDGTDPRRKFTVTELTPNTGGPRGGFPDDWFNFGLATFESGNNDGASMEIRDFVADDGITIEQDIELFLDLPFDIQVGDKLRLYPGCDKRFETCRDKFANWLNFAGEPFVSTPDEIVKYPDARG